MFVLTLKDNKLSRDNLTRHRVTLRTVHLTDLQFCSDAFEKMKVLFSLFLDSEASEV